MNYLPAKEFRRRAWEKLAALDGKTGYGTFLIGLLLQFAVGIVVVVAVLVVCTCLVVATGGKIAADMQTFPETSHFAVLSLVCLLMMVTIYGIASFVKWGQKAMSLALMRGGLKSSHALSGKGNVWRMTSLIIWTHTYVFLWALLFIIPGIRAMFSYAMAPYLIIDHPDWSPRKCIAESKRMMKGFRWRFFCLHLSFIGWHLLANFVAFFLGGFSTVLLIPYVESASAAFYEDLLDREENHNEDV